MSSETRKLKQKTRKKKTILIGAALGVILLTIIAGYFRVNQKLILESTEYTSSVNTQLWFFKDVNILKLDSFQTSDLTYPEGTKASGYDSLTTSPKVINQEYLNAQIAAVDNALSAHFYDDWDAFAKQLEEKLSAGKTIKSDNTLSLLADTGNWAGTTKAELEAAKTSLQKLNTGSAVPIVLDSFGIMNTGYIYSTYSDYETYAGEGALGGLSIKLLEDLSGQSTQAQSAFKVVNNDHMFAAAVVSSTLSVNGEATALKYRQEYGKDMSNSAYYKYLTTRVDILRDYPEISFNNGTTVVPAYLVNVIQEDNKKILILLIKQYVGDLAQMQKQSFTLNVQNYRAYEVPQSAVIKKDDKTYLQLIEKGYFPEEVQVNVTAWDKGKAILAYDDNPDLKNGMSVKIYP